jgi:phage tail sheath protein FI
MPASYTYPGVYVEEVPSGVRPIAGVSTSSTAFVDAFERGPLNEAVRITSFADFNRRFGGLSAGSEASYAVQQFYLNGGSIAWVVRVAAGTPVSSFVPLLGGSPAQETLTVSAIDPGFWGDNLQVAATTAGTPGRFNLFVREVSRTAGTLSVVRDEAFLNLAMDTTSPRYAVSVVNAASSLVRLEDEGLGSLPIAVAPDPRGGPPAGAWQDLGGGDDGDAPDANAIIGDPDQKEGLYALDRIAPEVFNLLCLPRAAALDDGPYSQVMAAAATFCQERRAFLLFDIPASIRTEAAMRGWMGGHDTLRHKNAALYFPRLIVPDPLNEGRPREVGASGTMAGIYARTDAGRGVWKAPAGVDANLRNAEVTVKLTDGENGALNPIGVNVLRNFPVYGSIAWGARTLDGADQKASEWKYVPVRRTALYIEESLFQGLKWVVFEPNDEPLWAQIRLNAGAFMQTLFRQGAFAGTTPAQAYLVKCDKETTTQNDVDRGIVNILIGFAPLKPAEFVVLRIQQLAGQTEAA